MSRFLSSLLVALSLIFAQSSWAADRKPLTVLISVDGFRADYLQRGITPNLARLAKEGVRAERMQPAFPSLTFPNHYTLVTGQRPDRNGIVDNVMRDPARPGQTFRLSARDIIGDRFWWDQATPIWVTAEQAGIRTATMFWPGSEVDIQGVRPRDWKVFDQSLPPEARTDQVLAWLGRPVDERPAFVTLYFDDVDTAGHNYGPDSPQVNKAIVRIDAQIGRLADTLHKRGLTANMVVVADHGMASIGPERVDYLDDWAAAESFETQTLGAMAGIIPKPGREAEVLKGLTAPHPHASCWAKADIPARLHYGTNPRIPPIICLAQTGWLLETHTAVARRAVSAGGSHGFDPASAEMGAMFVATGPAFRKGVTLPSFENVDVYPLLALLIGVKPLAGEGTLRDLEPALKPHHDLGRAVP